MSRIGPRKGKETDHDLQTNSPASLVVPILPPNPKLSPPPGFTVPLLLLMPPPAAGILVAPEKFPLIALLTCSAAFLAAWAFLKASSFSRLCRCFSSSAVSVDVAATVVGAAVGVEGLTSVAS